MRLLQGRALQALKRVVARREPASRSAEQEIVSRFHELYYYARQRTWEKTFWLNVPTAKCPLDLWIYQEIIWQIKPDIIIEAGTAYGGSALFLASICDLLNCGQVITIDVVTQTDRPAHKRIKYLSGSSTADEIIAEIGRSIKVEDRVLVILDSDHHAEHVRRELDIYSRLVTVGSYLIVEDTNINGHPVLPLYGAGPMEAVEQFLKTRPDFVLDRDREKFFMTFNPKGYLRRVS